MPKDTMICPFCKYEMLSGEVRSSHGLNFTYEAGPSKYQNHTPAMKHLFVGSSLMGTRAKAWACKRCGKLIIDCELKENGLDLDKRKKRKVWDQYESDKSEWHI